MSEHPCAICGLLVYSSEREETWGIEFGKSWFHYDCIKNLYQAMLRVMNAEKLNFEGDAGNETNDNISRR